MFGNHGSVPGGSATVRPFFDSARSRNQLIDPLSFSALGCTLPQEQFGVAFAILKIGLSNLARNGRVN
jgi:hypothetical protein